MSNWKSVLGAVAPTVASALGGPFAGAAVKSIASKLGLSDAPSQKDLEVAVLGADPDTLLKLREAENEFQTKMAQLGIDLEKIDADDRSSARQRQVAMKDWTPNVLAGIILVGFFVVQWFSFTHVMPTGQGDVIARTLGTLDMMTGAVVFYFFGSSRGSRAKDETISTALAKQ